MMKIDPETWVLASAAAGLLLAGGAFLRAAFMPPTAVRAAIDPPAPPISRPVPTTAAPASELAALREQVASANTARETQRAEMVEQRQRAERQVQGAQAEIQRLAAELDSERARAEAAEKGNLTLRDQLKAGEHELSRAKTTSPDPKALATLSGEVADLQQKVKTATEERDQARAKAEALERLIEGVRARSRDLAEQVRVLKGEAS